MGSSVVLRKLPHAQIGRPLGHVAAFAVIENHVSSRPLCLDLNPASGPVVEVVWRFHWTGPELLHEAGHASRLALLDNGPRPRHIERAGAGARFAANYPEVRATAENRPFM